MTWHGWLIPWHPSLLAIAITGIVATLFYRGAAQEKYEVERKLYFWLGLGAMYAVTNTGFNYFAHREFFVHRLQHTVLHHLGPFLIALSAPGAALDATMPLGPSRWLRQVLRYEPLATLIDTLNHPIVAALLFDGLILFWLIPSIHTVAMLNEHWYFIMNASMALNGLMFWGLMLNGFVLRQARLSAATRIVVMLAVVPPQIIIGALISFAPRSLYGSYALCGRAIPGITALQDQQLGGLILWVPAAMMSVLGVIVVISREWLHPRRPISDPAFSGFPASGAALPPRAG